MERSGGGFAVELAVFEVAGSRFWRSFGALGRRIRGRAGRFRGRRESVLEVLWSARAADSR